MPKSFAPMNQARTDGTREIKTNTSVFHKRTLFCSLAQLKQLRRVLAHDLEKLGHMARNKPPRQAVCAVQ